MEEKWNEFDQLSLADSRSYRQAALNATSWKIHAHFPSLSNSGGIGNYYRWPPYPHVIYAASDYVFEYTWIWHDSRGKTDSTEIARESTFASTRSIWLGDRCIPLIYARWIERINSSKILSFDRSFSLAFRSTLETCTRTSFLLIEKFRGWDIFRAKV